ncbi:hypothetical protein [Bacillus sp. FJAT-45350]|uniref:hypothetical protein n=1 Tax=Bacillus sp. FJAT-45350 TaxID=2011014 RepID=UPI000BB92489|nr:hypothetical protein [Bacillus sp. FJAT-45350]
MGLTELGWGMFSYFLLIFYLLFMLDFPLKRGRNLFERFEGIKGMVYALYASLCFIIVVATGIMVSWQVAMLISYYGSLLAIVSTIATFTVYIVITLSVIEKRSRNELFLLRLKNKYPLLDELQQ